MRDGEIGGVQKRGAPESGEVIDAPPGTQLYECNNCAFSFNAVHACADGTFACPVCAESRYRAIADAATEKALRGVVAWLRARAQAEYKADEPAPMAWFALTEAADALEAMFTPTKEG